MPVRYAAHLPYEGASWRTHCAYEAAAWVCTKGVLIGTPEVRGAVGAKVERQPGRGVPPQWNLCHEQVVVHQMRWPCRLNRLCAGERLAALPVLRADSPCGMVWLKLRIRPRPPAPACGCPSLGIHGKAMFEALQDGLTGAFKTLRGQGKLSEANMRDGLKLVEKSLLEADVSFPVVRDFMSRVTEQAVGEKVLKSLNPSQQVVGIVYQELVNLMGPVDHSLHLKGKDEVTVLMMCGLQGSGKTTTCGKLGRMLKAARPQAAARRGRLAAPRGHRPAARARRAARHPGLLRPHAERSRRRLPAPRSTRGQEARRRRRDPRHGRPAAHRRRVDGASSNGSTASARRTRSTWSSTA